MSTESASRVKQPVDTVTHILMLYKLATVSLLNAFLHSSDEAGLIFEHTTDSFLHQLLGGGAIMVRDLRKLRFLLGSEVNFHAFRVKAPVASVNRPGRGCRAGGVT